MKILNLDQNTTEWHEWRSSGNSASEAPAVMGESKYFPKTPYQLYLVQTGQKEVVYTKAMSDGHKFEQNGLDKAEEETGFKYTPVCARSSNHPEMIASLDGYNEEAPVKIVEVKTTTEGSDLWKNYKKIYKWQITHQAIVADVDQVAMVIYSKDTGSHIFDVIDIPKEDKKELLKAWTSYRLAVDNFEAPGLTKNDYIEIKETDKAKEWKGKAEKWSELKEKQKEIEDQIKEIKKEFIVMSEGQPTKGYGISVFPVTRKGNIQYKKIPELNGVDLEKYRGKSSTYWSVR